MQTGLNRDVMLKDRFVPWDFYPKELSHEQVQNPLLVVKEFFRIAKFKARQLSLREWRDFVVKDEHYRDEEFGPGPLLFIYEWNIKLIEALYLLLLDSKHSKPKPVTEDNKVWEEYGWPAYPDNLSEEELKDPFIAIEKVFRNDTLPYYREILWQWLEEALTIRIAADEMPASDIIPVYDNLLKLYSAAWVIQMRIEDAEDELNGPDDSEIHSTDQTESVVTVNEPQSKPVISSLTPAAKLGMDQLIPVILKAAPFVEVIYCLGTHDKPFTYYLLILISDDEKTPEHEVANKIEDHCRYLGIVFVLAHKTASARQGRADGKLFWNNTMENAECVFKQPELETGIYNKVSEIQRLIMATHSWERWGIQAKGFLDGAETYLDDQNYNLAAFMLHQAAESTFIAVINIVLGYRLSSHNLSRMLKLTLLFTGELKSVFELDTEKGIRQFDVLQTSYSAARYKDSFVAEDMVIESLYPKVELLLEKAEGIYREFVGI